MLEALYNLFKTDGPLSLSGDIWLIAMLAIVAVAFLASLIAGLVGGAFNKTKSVMNSAVKKPNNALAAIKLLPADAKAQYKNARMGNLKPSILVTKQVCVDEPYKRSIISKIWLITLIATLLCGLMAFFVMPLQAVPSAPTGEVTEEALSNYYNSIAAVSASPYMSGLIVLLAGGLFTFIGGIIGAVSYSGASNLYGKFIKVLDGDQAGGAQQAYSEPQPQPRAHAQAQAQQYAEPQPAYEPQAQPYAEPQQQYAEPQQPMYGEPVNQQPMYGEPEPQYAAEPVFAAQQESDEEIRRRAREEAMAQMRAQQQAAQQQAAQQPQQPPYQAQQAQPQQAAYQAQQQAPVQGGSSSMDEVIAKIDKIEREGASREVMREVATLIQKERAKPENKSPERQKRLNEALSKLLKAMSGARK